MRLTKGTPDPNLNTAAVLDILCASDRPLDIWGTAMDGTPLYSARAGGVHGAPVLIAAGVHSGESAGIHAALHLLSALETDHPVYCLPVRDPFGFAGVNHCISWAAGKTAALKDHTAALEFLHTEGQLLWHAQDCSLFKLGDFGFAWFPLHSISFYQAIEVIAQVNRQQPEVLQPLWGRRVMLLDPDVGYEGAGEMLRCWHGVMSRSGEWLHLNRFFGREDAPSEVAALQQMLETLQPGLVIDLQEDRVGGFWLASPHSSQDQEVLLEMTRASIEAIKTKNCPVYTFQDMQAENHPDLASAGLLREEPTLPGLFWMRIQVRGEGDNFLTFAGQRSLCLGIESPMRLPLRQRVEGIVTAVQAAVRTWEHYLVSSSLGGRGMENG